ncbi:MAG: class I SAM-dependent methyltransferase [Gemmatimonadetes bacterium]|nr:class I SAM-dependent methyltransferase [Gemmatimonadota bacterium]
MRIARRKRCEGERGRYQRRRGHAGCGPTSPTLSLVHCADVHVLDPLLDLYQEIQPFGWEFFASLSPCGAERLPFEKHTLDFVHCANVLDHTRDAEEILTEIGRVLRPGGQLLFSCDVRSIPGGGAPHSYNWDTETLEERIFSQFDPLTSVSLFDEASQCAVPRDTDPGRELLWVCRLRKKSELD